MGNDREKLLGKIRKLLAVTEQRGATEAEAMQAALAAQKLIADNDIEQWELSEQGEPIEGVTAQKTRNWQGQLALAIADNFRCKCYVELYYKTGARRRSKNVVFYGYRQDAQAAKLVYEKLSETGNRLGKHYASRRQQELDIQGYQAELQKLFDTWAAAFVDGVREALEKQSQALMIVCPLKVKEAFEESISGSLKGRERGNRRYNDENARSAGRRAGRDAVNAGRIGAASNSHLITA